MSTPPEILPLTPADDLVAYRRSLGGFPTGIAVMTAAHDGHRVGITANSFSSVSLDPPLVLWSLRSSSVSLPIFQNAGHFGVNVLAWHQQEISQRFARPADDKFDGLQVSAGEGDAPLLEGCAAHYECRLVHQFTMSDHVILFGEVRQFSNFHREPLIFFRGAHRWFDQPVIS